MKWKYSYKCEINNSFWIEKLTHVNMSVFLKLIGKCNFNFRKKVPKFSRKTTEQKVTGYGSLLFWCIID